MSASKLVMLPLGALFGWVLSRAGATTYDFYAGLFLFRDLQLLWVIATAAGLGALGVFALQRMQAKALIGGKPLSYKGKPWKRSLIGGAVLFGAGWGLAGACPGTAMVMLGEGKLGAVFTILGILAGTWLFGMLEDHKAARAAEPQGLSMDHSLATE